MTKEIWVCSKNEEHIYDKSEASKYGYFCPKEESKKGILIKRVVDVNAIGPVGGAGGGTSGRARTIEKPPDGWVIGGSIPPSPREDLGLCIMLLDCSGSMNDNPFNKTHPDEPPSKKLLIRKSVSAGIFSLSGNRLNKYAYVLILGFDHETFTLVDFSTIEEVVKKYNGNPLELEKALEEIMDKRQSLTDINGALEQAFEICQDFISSKIQALGDYKPRVQAVTGENMRSQLVPNVRVLLFTDGAQFINEGNTTLNPSPFKNLLYDGKKIDLLMGAYYGSKEDKDYEKLKTLVSKCPKHPHADQFFLFDNPTKLMNLNGLFRMASGASGFCPICLEEANRVAGGAR